MVNMVGNSAGFITPILTSAVTGHDPTDVTGWRNLFWISSSLLLTAMLVFVFFATASKPWERKLVSKASLRARCQKCGQYPLCRDKGGNVFVLQRYYLFRFKTKGSLA